MNKTVIVEITGLNYLLNNNTSNNIINTKKNKELDDCDIP